ncbi:ATP-dependent nuclease [Janthinobacterium sp. B9-8]|uniref:ATP-dependent nuclease n=1 Tax=Janthinobacterium sp. B9-8 TaxID=1236179 RepID=UPI00061D3904|nr:ATP-binding protein [Janthinobacterium sp. B9-8]AMC35281.1 OLD family endonuclease [Janthinobacterium sp. B9-8]
MSAPKVLRLHMERFRGFESLTWHPAPGMNIILGGGNVGKSTLLEAIALLLHPTNSFILSDSDYWQRKVEEEFCIEAVIQLPDSIGINRQSTVAWPWEWDGANAVLPKLDTDENSGQPVYKIQVRGTADLELVHELVQPDGSSIHFSTALRRSIGLVRLAGDDKNDRDLRLIQGSGLDRLLADKGLRAKLGRKIALDSIEDELNPEAQEKLSELDTKFGERALPTELGLGFVGGAGLSINALVGLTAKKNAIVLPLTSWGSGTRRLAALAIADTLQERAPITLVDELERGLEPYRQRSLVYSLRKNVSQTLITTHSSAVIGAAAGSALWYIDAKGAIGALPADKIATHQQLDPETFLARLAVVAEGATETGFVKVLLTRFLPTWEDEGVHVTDAGGNENVLKLLEAMSEGGLRFAGFADCEPASLSPTRWGIVKAHLGDLLLRWEQGCLEENILPLFSPLHFDQLITDPEEAKRGMRLRSLADRLGLNGEITTQMIQDKAGDQLIQLVTQAATGMVPASMKEDKQKTKEWKGHARLWFKSVTGGHELAEKMFSLGVWPNVETKLLPLINALKTTIGYEERI